MPENAEAQFHIGVCYMAQGKYAEALVELEKAVEKYPDDLHVLRTRRFIPRCYIELGKYEQALEALQNITLKHPGTVEAASAQISIGHLYYHRLKYYRQALEAFQNVVDGYHGHQFEDVRQHANRYIKFCKAQLEEDR